MSKSPRQTLQGLDALLKKQALEMATLRAARDTRRAVSGQRTPKCYRLGPENADGTVTIEVSDGDAANWRTRETCANVELAQERAQQLNADDAAFFRR